MEEKREEALARSRAYWRAVKTWGLYLGAILAVLAIVQVTFLDSSGSAWISMVEWLSLFFLGYKAMVSYQAELRGEWLTYGRSFSIGIMVCAVAAVVYALVYHVMITAVRPQYFHEVYTLLKGVAQEQVSSLDEAEAERNYEMIVGMITPAFLSLAGFIGVMVNGLFATLISALWGKRNYRLRNSKPGE
ncbi:MAG: hypothetical protein CSA97_04760 [Bacteroidetes bacterium]|nr:MAG: hypothetical protein CSA97_04760 [Bacteroidota bacterium]